MQKRDILVYSGEGADEDSVKCTIQLLTMRASPVLYEVKTILPSVVIEGSWRQNAAMFTIPGGYDRGVIDALGDEGAAQIRDYVWSGGSYFGIGSGAYYATDYIEFDKGGHQEVVGPRPLKFYPGKGIGPVYGPYNYTEPTGARAAPVQYVTDGSQADSKVYFNGGAMFVPYDIKSTITKKNVGAEYEMGLKEVYTNRPEESTGAMGNVVSILGSYTKLEDSPTNPTAIVECEAGNGKAALCGPQMEFSSKDLDPTKPCLRPIKKQIEPFDVRNDEIITQMLRFLGIVTI